MRFPHGILPLRLLPRTLALPLFFLFGAGLGGASSLHEALTNHYFFQADTWWIPWLSLAVYNFSLSVWLHPMLRLIAPPWGPAPVDPEDLQQRWARQARHRLALLPVFAIALSVALLFLGDGLVVLRQGWSSQGWTWDSGFFTVFKAAMNLSAGFFLGVYVHFSLENGLFLVKKRIRDLAPDLALPYQSLYAKIFLALAAITLHLLAQTVSILPSFIMIDRPDAAATLTTSLEATGDPGAQGTLKWMRKNADVLFNAAEFGAKDALEVYGAQMLLTVVFILLMLAQVKTLIHKPVRTVQGRLRDLNSGRPEDLCTIDVVQNDEFAEVFVEINRLIEAQQSALHVSRQRLLDVVAGAADPIIVFDAQGQIEVFNPAAEAFFGYSAAEARQLSFTALVELPEEVACACETTALPLIHYLIEERSTLARHQGLHRDGRRLPFESNISTAQTPTGPLFTAILRDIRAQLEVEETLTRAKTAAETANRMKSEFLANMSHELRTPLNAVLGYTQLLSNDRNLTEGQLAKIDTISRSGEHLLALINDILDISKIEAGKFEVHETVFDPRDFVQDLGDLFRLRCQKKGLHLDVEVLEGLPTAVRGDLGKLRQVMINLVGNAVKFTAEGGVGLVVGPDGDRVRFSVNDSGKGIPSDELELILQPFTQSSNTDHEGGTGLGLAISHRFIEMMGGRLEIESRVGVGSTFSFALPLAATDEVPVTAEPELKAVAVKEGAAVTVLIVDDKTTNRLILKEMLEGVGFSTIEAENGREAVDRARQFRPRLVFLDIKMPVLDGYGAVTELKADPELRAIPVFALTASAFKHDEERIRQAGFDGFLAKPFKQSSLFRLIRDRTDIVLEYEQAPTTPTAGSTAPLEAPATVAARLGATGRATLDELVLINDFTGIRTFAEGLRGDLPGFAGALIHHAAGFDDAAIAKLLADLDGPTPQEAP